MSSNTMFYALATIGAIVITLLWALCLVCVINGLASTVGWLSLKLRRCEKAIMLHRERAAKAQQSRFAREYEAGPNLWDEGQGEA